MPRQHRLAGEQVQAHEVVTCVEELLDRAECARAGEEAVVVDDHHAPGHEPLPEVLQAVRGGRVHIDVDVRDGDRLRVVDLAAPSPMAPWMTVTAG